ncbi:glycosyltransferase family 4 protein [Actinotalea ferrariae]|uniref:glycosyltransferase family 4 protein n=1 Tax=Actinotalea ferrariae TaxID=1386098 RepID=UPI001C8B2323|nr:glycosyltransferase family 4 protein [Actinotalea ferrariae]MBX9243522.1 glycosyltransferase family 4 protein [Actinotalea ferrariae]
MNTRAPGPSRINHFSESVYTVQGHGVHTAFTDLVSAQRRLGLEVGVNEDWRDGVLHVHTVGPTSLGRLLRHRGLRVVSAHVTPGSLKGSLNGVRLYGGIFTTYLRRLYDVADVVIAVSDGAAAEVREMGVRTPVVVVPNAVVTETFRPTPERRAEARAALGLSADDFAVLGVGQLQPRKGIEEFVECARRMPDVRFMWLGDCLFGAMSDGRARMKRVVAEAPANMDFAGQKTRGEVARYCWASDVFLFPSRHETFGMAPVEAAFAGLPLVMRDLPVFTGVFGSDQAFLGAQTVDGFVDHLTALRDDPAQRRLAAGRASSSVTRYAGDAIAARMVDLYEHWTAHTAQRSGVLRREVVRG